MAYKPVDFFEGCLQEVESIVLTHGWNDNSWRQDPDGGIDLTRAIEQVARDFYTFADGFDYPELDTVRELTAEMKAYLSTFMPIVQHHYAHHAPRTRAGLDGFNDSNKTVLADVLEVLELAREAYNPAMTGYRKRHNKGIDKDQPRSNTNIWQASQTSHL